MGKSSSQVVGYRYYAKFAAFIGNRIEKLIAINFDNRKWVIHDPEKHPPNLLPVLENNLFGENEGGVSGQIDIHFGYPDPEPNATYKQYFPLVSGYPYQSYLIFRGYPGAAAFTPESLAKNGFYLGNSGYMKEMLLWVKRTRVRNDGQGQWYEVRDDGAVVCEIGVIYGGFGSPVVPTSPVGLVTVNSRYTPACNLYDAPINWSGSSQFNSVSTVPRGTPIPAGYYIPTPTGDSNAPSTGCINGFIDDPVEGYYKHTVQMGGTGFAVINFQFMIPPEKYGHNIGFTCSHEYTSSPIYGDNEDAAGSMLYRVFVELPATIEMEWKTKAVPRNDGTGRYYYAYGLSWLRFYQLEQQEGYSADNLDINPIHKIREILTDDTAMGKPEADVNDANFIKAADRIYDEGLGISWAIDEKSCIEAIEELCYHIEAGIRVNRQTGLYEMVLFRDDWFSEDEIHDIAENKIKDLSLEVMNSDDIVNQLNVTYYDRERIKNSTFSIYENGSILTMGHTNAESVEFPYFMNMRNAEIVANWKLKQFSTPAWSGSFSTGWREARKWNRYDLIRLPWSKKWNSTILARIMKINLGNGTDNTVTIDFEEVIPYSADTNVSIIVDTPVELAPLPPQPNTNEVFEAPYYLTVLRAGQSNTDLELSNNPDIGYVAAIAAKPQNNSLNALLYTDGGVDEFEQVSRLDYCDILQLDQPITEITSSFVVTGSLTQTANLNYLILLNDELMGFVSFNTETKVLNVKRGVLDTVPKKHSSGSLFVFDLPDVAFDSTQYAQSEIIEAQVLTTTPSGIQELSGTGQPIAIKARAIRPYPPANVKINGEYWPTKIDGDLEITWSHRNRLQQTAATHIDWFEDSVTKEIGVLYSARLYDAETDALHMEQTDLEGNSVLFGAIDPPQLAKLVLESYRDNYPCLYPYQHVFAWGKPPEDFITAFTSNGTFTVPAGITSIDVLIIAGGGGGGSRQGGGGGAGGLIARTISVTPSETISITVGQGGLGGINGGRGQNGKNSSFGSLVAIGGGGGGGRTTGNTGANGGSGGGGGATDFVGASSGGLGAQGADGGAGVTQEISLTAFPSGGGGGGAGGAGGTSTGLNAGNGGAGLYFPILNMYGDDGYFAGGGGGGAGGASGQVLGATGKGGGGAGGVNSSPQVAPSHALANTGGGGGGSGIATTPGGNGGSGIVIIVYPAGKLTPTIMAKRAITVTV